MKSKDDCFVYDSEHGCWMHKTLLKYLVNPIFRFIQFWTDEPFVIYSKCEREEGKWHFEGFGKVKYLKNKRRSNKK